MGKGKIIVLDEAFGEKLQKGYDEVLAETFINLTHYSSGERLEVNLQIPKKIWDLYRKHDLGMLYGVDLSNYLSRRGILNEYSIPVVSDKKNARNGLKDIQVTYYLKRGGM